MGPWPDLAGLFLCSYVMVSISALRTHYVSEMRNISAIAFVWAGLGAAIEKHCSLTNPGVENYHFHHYCFPREGHKL